jgi:hypothetical protein
MWIRGSDQIKDMELAAGMTQQLRKVVQSFGFFQPKNGTLVCKGPVVTFSATHVTARRYGLFGYGGGVAGLPRFPIGRPHLNRKRCLATFQVTEADAAFALELNRFLVRVECTPLTKDDERAVATIVLEVELSAAIRDGSVVTGGVLLTDTKVVILCSPDSNFRSVLPHHPLLAPASKPQLGVDRRRSLQGCIR